MVAAIFALLFAQASIAGADEADPRRRTEVARDAFFERMLKASEKEAAVGLPTLLENYGVDFFLHRRFDCCQRQAKLVTSNTALYPGPFVQLLEDRKLHELAVAGAMDILYYHFQLLNGEQKAQMWRLLDRLRRDKNALVRRQATKMTAHYKGKEDIYPIYVRALEDDEDVEGGWSPTAITGIDGITALRTFDDVTLGRLFSLLNHKNPRIRGVTAASLPQITSGDREARSRVRDCFLKRLAEGDEPIMEMASALPALDPPGREAAAILIKLYRTKVIPEERRRFFLSGLGRIKGAEPFIEDFLCTELLSSGNRDVKTEVISILRKFKSLTKESLVSLRNALALSDPTLRPAIQGLISKHDR